MGRDFFDIVFLISQTKPNYEYLKKKLDINNGDELKKVLLSRTLKLDFNELAKDIEPFLINTGESKRVLLFREYIQSVEF
ncbi:hypothetical protein GYA01_00940 [Patescibacteria group bacterium]|nr:hypothetical protein [Patescibacteria group bacterium]